MTGKIFPGGTIPTGISSFDPNQPGSIGTWVCSGVFVADAADIFSGKAMIAFHTNQIFIFADDHDQLFTEGLEGSVGQQRTGSWLAAPVSLRTWLGRSARKPLD